MLARVLAGAAKSACGARVSPAAVYRSLHDMRRVLHLTHSGSHIRGRLVHLERLAGKAGLASSLIRPAEPLAADCANSRTAPGPRAAANEPSPSATCSTRPCRSPCRFSAQSSNAIISKSPSIRDFSPRISAALQRKFNFLEPIDRFRMTSPSKAVKVSIVTKL